MNLLSNCMEIQTIEEIFFFAGTLQWFVVIFSNRSRDESYEVGGCTRFILTTLVRCAPILGILPIIIRTHHWWKGFRL